MNQSSPKHVYTFGNGTAEGNRDMRDLLGGKGANLAEMSSIGLPVPPGFTISTETCGYYTDHKSQWPKHLNKEVERGVLHIENVMGSKLGSPDNPLLVSVRSGAAISMPGMMDTVLNLGLNAEVADGLAKKTRNKRFVYDAYRRLIDMFGDVVMGVHHSHFEHAIDSLKKERGVWAGAAERWKHHQLHQSPAQGAAASERAQAEEAAGDCRRRPGGHRPGVHERAMASAEGESGHFGAGAATYEA